MRNEESGRIVPAAFYLPGQVAAVPNSWSSLIRLDEKSESKVRLPGKAEVGKRKAEVKDRTGCFSFDVKLPDTSEMGR